MPRYLSLIRVDEQNAPAQQPGPEFEARMGELFAEVTKAGVMVDTAGLRPTAEGIRITWSGGSLSSVDGPFTEGKEVIGGYAILQVADLAEAQLWTRRFLEAHGEYMTVTAELREIDGA